MTVRNLDSVFKPRSVALIGASERSGSLGALIARNLFGSPLPGPVFPVNPKYKSVQGVAAWPDIASLPTAPDLGVICTPPETVPGLVAELGARGAKGAIVITAGFGEGGTAGGRQLRQAVLDAARPHLLRVIGPNCLGVIVPGAGLDASFSPSVPVTGTLAFIAQSGALVTSVIDWATDRRIGFSHLVSLGDMIDVDFGDMLDYLANDPGTSAILLYIEAVTGARKFMSAARAAARMKPVIVVKAGRHAEGARAAASHTGALAGADTVYDAVCRRSGMLRVYTLAELFDAVEILSFGRAPPGERLTILTNGGGIGVLATDALIEAGGKLAALDPTTLTRLDGVLPPTWSKGNPVDIIGDAPGQRYSDALDIVLEDSGTDAVLVLNCPTAVASGLEGAKAVTASAGRKKDKLTLTSWVGGALAAEARHYLTGHGLPTYDTPEQAVRAFMYLVDYRRGQETLMEIPPASTGNFEPDIARARSVIDLVLDEGRDWLTEPEAKAILDAYAIPVGETTVAGDVDEAVRIADETGFPVALKILSPDITHKSDVGGVALDLSDGEAVRRAADSMLARIAQEQPEARMSGFVVEPMIRRSGAIELIAGITIDPQFGPVILFGHGGTATELIDDTSLGFPPLNLKLARELISRTRISRQLRGYRDHAPADVAAIALTLVKLSQLVIDFAEIVELDINPLLADADGVIALDARIRVIRTDESPIGRLAIRPYPRELEGVIDLSGGGQLFVRPIVPEDEPSLTAFFSRLTTDEIHLRFQGGMKILSHRQAARLTQLDYDREMALIATEPEAPGQTGIHGVVRLSADPDRERAEFAIIVRSDMGRRGVGLQLLRRLIDYARDSGVGELFGLVQRENRPMLSLCARLGFSRHPVDGDLAIVRVALTLQGPAG